MKILTRLKFRPDLAGQYLNYPNDQIKTQAYDWYFEYRPEKIMDMLIAKLAQEDEDFFAAVFSDLHPDSASLERIAGIGKNGNSQERHNAAAIIALQGNYGQVVETLQSPDRDLRETCIKYIAANPLFPQMALKFKNTFPGPEEIQIKQAAVSLKTIKKLANTGSVELNRWVIKLLTSWSNSDEGIKKALDLNGY